MNKHRLLIASLVYLAGFIAVFPLYRYVFDPDGIGYMMIARRLAAGDFHNAINGYWSPLHAWLIAPFYKAGVNEFVAFKASNGLISLGILAGVGRLLKKVALQESIKTAVLFVCIPVLLSYAYCEIGADLLLCLLLLLYTDVITEPDFFTNTRKVILCSVIGCLGYFSKTYAFPLFLVHFGLVQLVLFRNSALAHRKALLGKNLLVGWGIFLLLAMPWICLLSTKYNLLTFGYSGKLNFSWQLEEANRTAVPLLVAPPYPGSPSHWEDPFFFWQMLQPHGIRATSAVIIKQVRLFLTNCIVALKCLHEISFLSMAVLVCLSTHALKKKTDALSLFFLLLLLLPSGYLLVHIETRFLWVATFLLLISGAYFVTKGLQLLQACTYTRLVYWCIFLGSFLIAPINQLKDMSGQGKDVFMVAQALQQKGITGSFATDNFTDYSQLQLLAYLTHSQAYVLSRLPFSYADLQQAMQEQHIHYFFYFYRNSCALEAFQQSSFYRSATQQTFINGTPLLVLTIP